MLIIVGKRKFKRINNLIPSLKTLGIFGGEEFYFGGSYFSGLSSFAWPKLYELHKFQSSVISDLLSLRWANFMALAVALLRFNLGLYHLLITHIRGHCFQHHKTLLLENFAISLNSIGQNQNSSCPTLPTSISKLPNSMNSSSTPVQIPRVQNFRDSSEFSMLPISNHPPTSIYYSCWMSSWVFLHSISTATNLAYSCINFYSLSELFQLQFYQM